MARAKIGRQSADTAILIGLGGNLPSSCGVPRQTLRAALNRLDALGVTTVQCSRFWETAPVPPSDQPLFVNAVAEVATCLPPDELLATLHAVEAEFGRQRSVTNAARTLDLDLLAHGRIISSGPVVLPHPRMAERAFVLMPMAEIVPGWHHPVSGAGMEAMIAALPADQALRPLP